jgi:hypothetical protein
MATAGARASAAFSSGSNNLLMYPCILLILVTDLHGYNTAPDARRQEQQMPTKRQKITF